MEILTHGLSLWLQCKNDANRNTAVCREIAYQKGENNINTAHVQYLKDQKKKKLERIAFRFFGSCKNSANRCTVDCRSLVTLEFLPRSHRPIRYVCGDIITRTRTSDWLM